MDVAQISQIHLVRHGEVRNPTGILYGRLPGYHLSDTGLQMADRLGEWFSRFDIEILRSSPLERAQETMAPVRQRFEQADFALDERLIEAENYFAGQVFGKYNKALFMPKNWKLFVNPMRPSWGEPYLEIASRMHDVINEVASQLTPGRDAVLVSHQLPIWIARLAFEGRCLMHDPRKRQCTLASVTSLRFIGTKLQGITYAEPARDLLRENGNRAFSSGS